VLRRKQRKDPATPNNKSKKRKLRPYIWVLIGLFIFMSISMGAGIGYTNHLLKDTPEWDPKVLQKTNETSIVYNSDGSVELTKLYGEQNRTTVDIKKVPELVKNAFLATEDVRFYDHSGIDFRALTRAVWANITNGFGSEGASTITQQVVKGAFLKPEKQVKRKVQEAYLAIQLERNYTKDEIFELYLNRIYFGHGAYGIQAAAQVYFNKSVDELNLPEAAMLAGLPQRPNGYSPFNDPKRAKDRRTKVIRNMERYEFISSKQAEAALKDDFSSLNTNRVAKDDSGNKINYPHPYFVEHVIEELIASYGADKVFNGGLRVYTTIDIAIQKGAEKVMQDDDNFPKSTADANGLKQPQGALVILDPKDGSIKALVGGRNSNQTEQRTFNRATQSKRQIGSTMKPILAYAPLIDAKGAGSGTVIDNAPVRYGKWAPKNSNGKYTGPVTVRTAIEKSINVPAVKAADMAGVKTSLDYAKKMELSLDYKEDASLGSTALGGLEVGIPPLELASAYATLANQGVYVKPSAILKIEDSTGKVLYEHKPKKTKVFKASTASILTDVLRTTVTRGTATKARFGKWQIAGKTGTTNYNKDIWFAGYTPELVAVVYIGHDQPKQMSSQYGGNYPALIWRKAMEIAHKEKKVTKFPAPKGVVYSTICNISGKKPSKLCPDDHIVTEMFPAGHAPSGVCDIHVEIEVCTESDLLPTEFCPTTEKKPFITKDATKVEKFEGLEPEDKCTIHNPENTVKKKIVVHDGKEYLANVPGPNQIGGCPNDIVQTKTYTQGTAPIEPCPLEEHKLLPKEPGLPPKTEDSQGQPD